MNATARLICISIVATCLHPLVNNEKYDANNRSFSNIFEDLQYRFYQFQVI